MSDVLLFNILIIPLVEGSHIFFNRCHIMHIGSAQYLIQLLNPILYWHVHKILNELLSEMSPEMCAHIFEIIDREPRLDLLVVHDLEHRYAVHLARLMLSIRERPCEEPIAENYKHIEIPSI
jgi:hypothetical protein